jgi:hypothetical protein
LTIFRRLRCLPRTISKRDCRRSCASIAGRPATSLISYLTNGGLQLAEYPDPDATRSRRWYGRSKRSSVSTWPAPLRNRWFARLPAGERWMDSNCRYPEDTLPLRDGLCSSMTVPVPGGDSPLSRRGTDSWNPSPSSRESGANHGAAEATWALVHCLHRARERRKLK